MTATFIISRPPTANQLFRNVKGKGRVKTHQYLSWLDQAGWELKQWPLDIFYVPVSLDIEIQRTLTKKGLWSRKDGDADNFCKPVLDLLVINHILRDDSCEFVHDIRVRWVDTDLKQRTVRITINPVEDQRAA